jgi:WD repeat and SOF domain-containing protein 1
MLKPKISVSTISRNPADYTRDTTQDIHKVYRNLDPALHPFEQGREYTRALNAVKLDKMFSKPFLYALDGHMDGVYALSTLPSSLTRATSGSGDGEIRVWNLTNRKCEWRAKGHTGIVRGIVASTDGSRLFSAGMDSCVKLWNTERTLDDIEAGITPLQTFLGKHPFTAIDHHRKEDMFVTSGATVELWDPHRTDALHSFEWGADTVNTVKFSPVEHNILVSTASDRNIILYDVRARTPLKKLIMKMQTNAVAFNPMEAFYFTTANEDHNCYTFDMRKLDHAVHIHEDHVSAVIALDYSPTGKEIVTGSYDRTIRIFPTDAGHSREVYHTKRMQRIFCVKYTADNRYILSGSDDTNIRLWKARAAEKIGNMLPRERAATNYRAKLKERFQHAPQIRAIARDRKTPKAVLKARRLKHDVTKSTRTKEQRVRAHSKAGAVPFTSKKKAVVRKEIE